MKWDTVASSEKIEAEMPFEKRLDAKSVYALLSRTVTKHQGKPAVSFQLDSDPKAKAESRSSRLLKCLARLSVHTDTIQKQIQRKE